MAEAQQNVGRQRSEVIGDRDPFELLHDRADVLLNLGLEQLGLVADLGQPFDRLGDLLDVRGSAGVGRQQTQELAPAAQVPAEGLLVVAQARSSPCLG